MLSNGSPQGSRTEAAPLVCEGAAELPAPSGRGRARRPARSASQHLPPAGLSTPTPSGPGLGWGDTRSLRPWLHRALAQPRIMYSPIGGLDHVSCVPAPGTAAVVRAAPRAPSSRPGLRSCLQTRPTVPDTRSTPAAGTHTLVPQPPDPDTAVMCLSRSPAHACSHAFPGAPYTAGCRARSHVCPARVRDHLGRNGDLAGVFSCWDAEGELPVENMPEHGATLALESRF